MQVSRSFSQQNSLYKLLCDSEEKFSLIMEYKAVKDYPMDIYVLLDLSKSMENETVNLSTLGKLLTDTFRDTRSDFRFGLGTITNVFKNELPLNSDMKEFSVSELQSVPK